MSLADQASVRNLRKQFLLGRPERGKSQWMAASRFEASLNPCALRCSFRVKLLLFFYVLVSRIMLDNLHSHFLIFIHIVHKFLPLQIEQASETTRLVLPFFVGWLVAYKLAYMTAKRLSTTFICCWLRESNLHSPISKFTGQPIESFNA